MNNLYPSYPWLPIAEQIPCCSGLKPILKIKSLSLSYNKKFAFKDISLTINQGCVTAIVGPSGCGKSSFLMSLNKLIEFIPGSKLSGQIDFLGKDILRERISQIEISKQIGIIFQKPNPFPLSIKNNIMLTLNEHNIGDKFGRQEMMIAALKAVGLYEEVKDRLNQSAINLSGGQQQRLCIARALAVNPQVLLMDEPCSALDPGSTLRIEETIKELSETMTIVIVTHNMQQAARVSDFTAFFLADGGPGEMIETAPTSQIFSQPRDKRTENYVTGRFG